MKNSYITAASIAALMLSGCATRASSVAPVAVSANDYSELSCDQARDHLQMARARENALAKRQNNAALADAASVFLVLLPLGSVLGADVAGDLAQAKGETLALERRIINRCNRPDVEPMPVRAAEQLTSTAPPLMSPTATVTAAATCGVIAKPNGVKKIVPCR